MAIDDESTEYELDVARAIVRLRELFQSAPYLVSDNNVPGLGIVTWRDLKTLQIYADNEFESRRPLRTPSRPEASGGVEAEYVKKVVKALRAGHPYSGVVDGVDTAAANLIEALYLITLGGGK